MKKEKWSVEVWREREVKKWRKWREVKREN